MIAQTDECSDKKWQFLWAKWVTAFWPSAVPIASISRTIDTLDHCTAFCRKHSHVMEECSGNTAMKYWWGNHSENMIVTKLCHGFAMDTIFCYLSNLFMLLKDLVINWCYHEMLAVIWISVLLLYIELLGLVEPTCTHLTRLQLRQRVCDRLDSISNRLSVPVGQCMQ